MSLRAYTKRVIWESLAVLLLLVGAMGNKEGCEDFTGCGRTLHSKTVIFSSGQRKKSKEEKKRHNTAKENPYWWPKIILGYCATVVLVQYEHRDIFIISVSGFG